MITTVIKRNGSREKFDATKISHAIFKAAKEVSLSSREQIITDTTLPLVLDAIKKYPARAITIEDIQDIVEEILMITGFSRVAKAYIMYRKYREEIRLTKKLGIHDELKLSLNAIILLKERYLLKNDQRQVYETPKEIFRRVAVTIAKAEINFSAQKEISPAHINAASDLGGGCFHAVCPL